MEFKSIMNIIIIFGVIFGVIFLRFRLLPEYIQQELNPNTFQEKEKEMTSEFLQECSLDPISYMLENKEYKQINKTKTIQYSQKCISLIEKQIEWILENNKKFTKCPVEVQHSRAGPFYYRSRNCDLEHNHTLEILNRELEDFQQFIDQYNSTELLFQPKKLNLS